MQLPSRYNRLSRTSTLSARKPKRIQDADIIVKLSEDFFSAEPSSRQAVCERTDSKRRSSELKLISLNTEPCSVQIVVYQTQEPRDPLKQYQPLVKSLKDLTLQSIKQNDRLPSKDCGLSASSNRQ